MLPSRFECLFSRPSCQAAQHAASPLVAHIVARDELRRELWAAIAIAQVLGR